MIEYKTVEGSPKYMVSNQGDVVSMKRDRSLFLAANVNSCGYKAVRLGRNKTLKVHRLVWDAFGDEPFRDTIDHIDGDKQNNHIGNLQILTMAEHNRKTLIDKKGYVGHIRKAQKGRKSFIVQYGKKYICSFKTEEEALNYLHNDTYS